MRLAMLAAALIWGTAAAAQRYDLSGTVLDEKSHPIAGATVYIYTASVREGTSPFCPSCYPDCGKKAKTDERGAFGIVSLDPALLFKVLAVAEGYSPRFVEKIADRKSVV